MFVVMWSGLELRRRWRSLVVLALLVAFATATILTAVAGARRGDSAVERLSERTLPATAVVLPNEPEFDWDAVRALPEVESVGTFAGTGVFVDGLPEGATWFMPGDGEALRTVERPVVLEGRMPDPDRVDEVVVTPLFLERHRKGVGDTVTMRLATPEETDSFLAEMSEERQASGPVIRARIVGVVRSGVFSAGWGDVNPSTLIPSAAVFDRYRANVLGAKGQGYLNALVRLRGGEAAMPTFRADLARVGGRSDIDVWDMTDRAGHTQRVDAFEAVCLLALALAALLAAVVLVGQSVARHTAATVGELGALRTVGMTQRQAMLAASAGPVLAALAGATAGVAAAMVASYWMPMGAAAAVEPSPGVDVDALVLAAGWLAVPLAVLALSTTRQRPAPRRSAIALAAARAGLPVPVVVGARFALEPGRGRDAVPVRSTLLGVVAGVLGVLASATFSVGVSDAVGNLDRFGQTHHINGWLGFGGSDLGPADEALSTVEKDADVVAVNDARIAVAKSGDTSVTMYTLAPVDTPLRVVLSAGRLPSAAGEVVLAPTTARLLDARAGSTVRFAGSGDEHRLRVTGVGFVPDGPQNGYDEGGWLTAAGYDRLFTGFQFHIAQVVLRPGVDAEAAVQRLQRSAEGAIGLESVAPPRQVEELRDVRVLPVVLGAFLGLLSVGAVGHALATAVRRRRHEMAVLRALGMTRRQSGWVVVVQASLLASIGLVFGVPLGLALGRTLWRLVADTMPLFYEPPVAFAALVLVAPVALTVAYVLAAVPARRAARLRVGHELRTE